MELYKGKIVIFYFTHLDENGEEKERRQIQRTGQDRANTYTTYSKTTLQTKLTIYQETLFTAITLMGE